MTAIHIEGMGWMGAALAFRLASQGTDFTWHDTNAAHVAWRACTGLVYPAGDDRSQANLARWDSIGHVFPAGTVLPAAYTYAHKAPPHAGRYQPRADLGWVRVADAACYAVDAPAIVAAARTQFAAARTAGPDPGQRVIVAHGHHTRRGGWVWGWSAPVRLELPDDLLTAAAGRVPALYGRAHRFAITYAYPIPSQPGWWWAGSSLMNQRQPRELDAAAHFRNWRRHFAALYPPVRLVDLHDPRHGWRPKPRPNDTGQVETDGNRLVFPPLWHSGVRWAPLLLDTAAAWATTGTLPTTAPPVAVGVPG